jgi:hypothetical protein
MARIQLRFVTENDPISYFIRKETDFPYSHVEFLTDSDWLVVAQKVKYNGNAAVTIGTIGAHFSGGFIWRPIDYAKFVASEIAYVECTDEQKEAVITEALKTLGTPYDTLEIFGILFGENWSTKGHNICSRVATTLLQFAGNIKLFNLAQSDLIDNITPRDVYMSPTLNIVQEELFRVKRTADTLKFSLGQNYDRNGVVYGGRIPAGTFAI